MRRETHAEGNGGVGLGSVSGVRVEGWERTSTVYLTARQWHDLMVSE